MALLQGKFSSGVVIPSGAISSTCDSMDAPVSTMVRAAFIPNIDTTKLTSGTVYFIRLTLRVAELKDALTSASVFSLYANEVAQGSTKYSLFYKNADDTALSDLTASSVLGSA
ncbi:MAG: hypothetical protein IJP96_00835, partial [Synergistaceae bacterium]|nr:hypothetical protein [Synergistaceae bacterium]